jgi:hypothetical protein
MSSGNGTNSSRTLALAEALASHPARGAYRRRSFFRRSGRGDCKALPLAVGMMVEETAGVRRFQAIKTAPAILSVRTRPRLVDQARGQDLFVPHPLGKLL